MLDNKEHLYEKAVLVGVITQNQDEEKLIEYMDELEFLALTAGATVVKRFTQKLTQPDSKTFIGSGKAQEIRDYVKENNIGTIIFDDELSPSQLKNLEREIEVKILDRTNLILDIFAQRAQTSYARTQVELAQYQYLLPRLTRMWTHLERQKGGIGMRGPGETEIETDRRIIRDRISLLKEKLKTIDRQMATQRNNRGKVVRAALVGYTNVGKSTLMNAISKSEVFAENKLFATLDTTVRKVVIGNLPFLLTDTVGFIRKLPTQLVESFKSTLDEVREADLLIHVVDISHESFEDHIDSVNQILMEINAHQKPMIMVFNKIDDFRYEKKEEDDLTPESRKNISLEEWQKTWMAKSKFPTVFISALTKENFPEMKKMIYDEVLKIHISRFPYNDFLFEYYDDEESGDQPSEEMPTHSEEIKEALQLLSVPEKAQFFPRFFKAGKGEYAEGDKFIGVTVPDQRQVAKEFAGKISLEELRKLLSSKIHEHRHCALLMLVSKFEKSKSLSEKTEIVQFYLKNKKYINNWDLVDNSCYKILGRFCFENNDGSILRNLSDEDHLWSKRMAVVGTMYHVKRGEFGLMKEFVLKNLDHPHDLMHKANGWLLREMGQKNVSELLTFLNMHYRKMPRTSLRYAIEKLDEEVRQDYLKGRI